MSATKALVKTCNGANNNALNGSYNVVGNGEWNFSTLIPASTLTSQSFGFPGSIGSALVLVIFMLVASTAASGITIQFNGTVTSSSNYKSYALSPGIPFSWDQSCYFANPLAFPLQNIYINAPQPTQFDIAMGLSV